MSSSTGPAGAGTWMGESEDVEEVCLAAFSLTAAGVGVGSDEAGALSQRLSSLNPPDRVEVEAVTLPRFTER